MSQLHEILAVEGDLKGAKDKIKEETIVTFSKKEAHFSSVLRRLIMFEESRKQEETEQRSELVTTVKRKLDYMSDSFSKYWDIKIQKEEANQKAMSDVTVDGITLIKNAPVTFLLSMEEELKQLRKVYDAIPTLSPGIEWVKDPLQGEDVYKSKHPVEKLKTEKTINHKIIVQPTEHHPAQIVEWSDDRPVGKYIDEAWSGMFSPAEKSLLLSRVDKVLRAVKKARQRANNQEVTKISVGKDIFNFIHGKA